VRLSTQIASRSAAIGAILGAWHIVDELGLSQIVHASDAAARAAGGMIGGAMLGSLVGYAIGIRMELRARRSGQNK
jgi:hypothetical protein